MTGGHHAVDTIKAGTRCPVQPTGDRCFEKYVSINGRRMPFRQAQIAGFLEWEHPVPLGADRSYAVWTDKAAAHNLTTVAPRPPTPRAPARRTTPAYGLQRKTD